MTGDLLGYTQVQMPERCDRLARDSNQTAAARITESIGPPRQGLVEEPTVLRKWPDITSLEPDLKRRWQVHQPPQVLTYLQTGLVLLPQERRSHPFSLMYPECDAPKALDQKFSNPHLLCAATPLHL